MINSISFYTLQDIPNASKKLIISLNEKQKQAIAIAILALGCLAAAIFAACRCCRKIKLSGVKPEVKTKEQLEDKSAPHPDRKNERGADPRSSVKANNESGMQAAQKEGIKSHPKKNPAAYTPFEKAMDLMFEDRGLAGGVSITSMSSEKKEERFEELKKNIALLSKEEINKTMIYSEGTSERSQTLLLQAIMRMKDPARRLEIAKMLINKGANPLIDGFCFSPIHVKKEALKTKDVQLIQLIEEAAKRQKLLQLISKGIAVNVIPHSK